VTQCPGPRAPQVYYKLSYVDRRVDGVEQRICEDVPKLCDELGELVREWCNRRAAGRPARGPRGTRMQMTPQILLIYPGWACRGGGWRRLLNPSGWC